MNTDIVTPQEMEASRRREAFLMSKGINPRQQQIVISTLNDIQDTVVVKVDATCQMYIRKWCRKARQIKPELLNAWLRDNNCLFQAVDRDTNPITGFQVLTYCLYQKGPPEKKNAFEIRMRTVPIMDSRQRQTGQLRLEMDSKEISWPDKIKIVEKPAA